MAQIPLDPSRARDCAPRPAAPRRRWLAGAALGFALVLSPDGATAGRPEASGDERLEYNWRVQGFFGAVAGMFFPARGEGVLSRRTLPGGNLESELVITSTADKEPDFFRYGAETSAATGSTVRAWSSQFWRGKRKDKSSPVDQPGVIDVASAIQLLRAERPARPQRMEIWSDGKLYPVEVRPMGRESVEVDGRRVEAFHVAVRPLVEAERRVWKGELDLWLADDPAATPVRILVSRSPARVLLELDRTP
jgi:hypothetical protein